jgi:hypothetical protein
VTALHAVLFSLAAASPGEETPTRDYLWRQAVQGAVVSGQLYRVAVGPGIFDACRAFPADIRVADENGVMWPFFVWSSTGKLDRVELKSMAPAAEDLKEGVQTLEFDSGVRHQPLTRLQISVSETNYARPLKVFGRNSPTNAWRWVADGGLHRIGDEFRDRIALRGCEYRWLCVELYRYEEPPLHVTEVVAERPPHFVVFEARGDEPPFVYFASDRLKLPAYDLQRRTKPETLSAAPELALGRKRMNPDRLAMSLGRYGRWLFAAAGTIFGALILIFAVKLWRRRAAG